MRKSPYSGKPEKSWPAITRKLVAAHPLKMGDLLDAAEMTWARVWQSTVGRGRTSIPLAELRVPATIVGYFFEVLLARELSVRYPKSWAGSQSKEQKDLVYIPDSTFSVEIKASGQRGLKIYGNRSYGQKSENELLVKKEKSGYYLTVNFYRQALTLLRFGWIDADDWDPQLAPTGQMAGLKKAVYDGKLIAISGVYRQRAPAILLNGVGPKMAEDLAAIGIETIGDLLAFSGELPKRFERVVASISRFLTVAAINPETIDFSDPQGAVECAGRQLRSTSG
jgi:hypothetical protein